VVLEINAAATTGRGRSGGRGFGNRGGRGGGRCRSYVARGGGGGPSTINGVDVSDVTHSFMDAEWAALRTNGGWDFVNRQREYIHSRGRGPGSRGVNNNSGGGYSGGKSGGQNDSRKTAAVGSQEESEKKPAAMDDRGHQHGTSFGRGAFGTGKGKNDE
jgi:hypothetical protein